MPLLMYTARTPDARTRSANRRKSVASWFHVPRPRYPQADALGGAPVPKPPRSLRANLAILEEEHTAATQAVREHRACGHLVVVGGVDAAVTALAARYSLASASPGASERARTRSKGASWSETRAPADALLLD